MSYIINNRQAQDLIDTVKRSVRVATTSNLNLAATVGTLDGVVLADGDRVLVKDQTTASENGIYAWASGTQLLTRTEDAQSLVSMLNLAVSEGEAHGNQSFQLTTPNPIVVGATNLTFQPLVSNAQVTSFVGAGTLSAGFNAIDPTGGYTVNLPAAPTLGTTVRVKNITDSTDTITVDGNGNTIDGLTELTLTGARISAQFVWDGFEWSLEGGLYLTPSSSVLAEWNETDVSQFTMVRGNGNDGVGSPGDWVLTASTFPGSDLPALSIQATGVTVGEAIWLFDDADPSSWDTVIVDWWATVDQAGGGKEIDLGVVFYYEDLDHMLMIRQWAADDIVLWGKNGASGDFVQSNIVTSVAENNTVGDWMRILTRHGKADGSTSPWAVAVTETSTTTVGSNRGVLLQSGMDADWQGLGTYTPRVGIFAIGFDQPDTEFMRLRFLRG